MSRLTRLLAIAFLGLGVTPALAQPPPRPPLPPAPPDWTMSADEKAALERALRDVNVTVREAMREVERELRDADRQTGAALAAMPRRSSGWAAMSWEQSRESRQGPEQVEKVSKTFNVGASGLLDLGNIAGDIQVKAGGGDTLSIEAVKRSRGADAKDQLASTEVRMTERPGRVEVRVFYAKQRNNNVSVDFLVTAPAGTSLSIKSVSGDVHINDIRGDVRAQSVSGDVGAWNTPGATALKSVSGDVEVTSVTHEGELRAESVSGDIAVRDSRVKGLTAETVSGDVQVINLTTDRLGAKTVTGGVEFSGPLATGGRYEMASHSGDVRVIIANNAGFELEATTFSGNVRSDFPVTLGGPGRDVNRAGHGRQAMRGVHGDGSAVLALNSFSGSITVTGTGTTQKK